MTLHEGLDQMLDDALAEYREAEPLAGLEDRVLQRVKSQTKRARRPWWRWHAIAAAAAVLAIAAWIGFDGRTRHVVVSSPVVQKGEFPAQPHRATERGAAKEQVAKANRPQSPRAPAPVQMASTAVAPMTEHFPSPAPLKPEERMLLALAQTHPEFLRELSRDDSEQEISIAPIHIKPLAETGDDQGEN
jgi:hypothetical protein